MNIVNHLINVEAIEKISGKILPYHTAVKNCKHLDENGNIIYDEAAAGATYEGNYMIPAVRCEDMYNNEIFYQIPARGCVVK